MLNVSFCCFIFGHLSHPPTKHHIHCGVLAKYSYVQQQSSKPLIISLVEIIATQINGKCMNVIFCLYVYKRINNIFQRRKSSYVDDNLELFHLIRPIYIFLHPKSNKPSTSWINIIFLFPFFILLLNFPVDSFNLIPSYQINCYFFRMFFWFAIFFPIFWGLWYTLMNIQQRTNISNLFTENDRHEIQRDDVH